MAININGRIYDEKDYCINVGELGMSNTYIDRSGNIYVNSPSLSSVAIDHSPNRVEDTYTLTATITSAAGTASTAYEDSINQLQEEFRQYVQQTDSVIESLSYRCDALEAILRSRGII